MIKKLALENFVVPRLNMMKKMNPMAEEQEWANLLAEVFDKLTEKHASITYDFDNLEMKGKVEKTVKLSQQEQLPLRAN